MGEVLGSFVARKCVATCVSCWLRVSLFARAITLMARLSMLACCCLRLPLFPVKVLLLLLASLSLLLLFVKVPLLLVRVSWVVLG